jgi:hypothetical protein
VMFVVDEKRSKRGSGVYMLIEGVQLRHAVDRVTTGRGESKSVVSNLEGIGRDCRRNVFRHIV